MNRTIKTALISATVLLGTTAGAFAATTAWADGKVKMKEDPHKWADTIDTIYDGEKVKVYGCFKNNGQKWCKIKYDGDVGYVRLSDLDFKKYGGDFSFGFGNGNFEIEFQF